MPLRVVDANEADVQESMRVDAAAYRGSIYERLFFPNGRSPEMLDLQARDLLKKAQEDPSMRNIKVIDTDDSDKPIAFARWYFYHGNNVQYIPVDSNSKGVVSGTDPAGLAVWNDVVRKRRIEYIGNRPHYCKSMRFEPLSPAR